MAKVSVAKRALSRPSPNRISMVSYKVIRIREILTREREKKRQICDSQIFGSEKLDTAQLKIRLQLITIGVKGGYLWRF
jgi:hypothetical protein